MKSPVTWILVADGGRAMILSHHGVGKGLTREPLLEMENDNAPTREQGADRPGRYGDSVYGRSAFEQTDWHRIEKERFAADLAQHLSRAAMANRYERLILIAPARTLGELRQGLSKHARGRIHAEISKDLTNDSPDGIASKIAEVLAV